MIWKLCESNHRLQKTLSDNLGVSPIFAQLLVNRNIKTLPEAHEFLFGDLSILGDPFLMKDMAKAVEWIKRAIEKKEKILIYGDYDADGVTSSALMAEVLEQKGAIYEVFIPNRLEEGYGLNIRAVALARDHGVKLIITVDCGINSVKEVECANSYGIDVIITDHHEVRASNLPNAHSIIDPHQKECAYPFKYLAGVGVAFKLAQGLLGDEKKSASFLDLVALGTIADVVPLIGENRILVKAGLSSLQKTARVGLKALMDVAGARPEKLTARYAGFTLIPRINAMGRIGSANIALDLLLCKDITKARELAKVLDQENRNRQTIEKDILKGAFERVKGEVDLEKEKIIVLADAAWHPGVIGIVASRLVDEYSRPAILISLDGARGKGSGRSVDGFNLFEAINSVGTCLVDFGGHAEACGIRIKKENIDYFKEGINRYALEFTRENGFTRPELKIDSKLPFAHIGTKFINELGMLMPYGPDNWEPVFLTGELVVKNNPRDIGRNGFKFLASSGDLVCEALTFRGSTLTRPKSGDLIDVAYTPTLNSWNGIESVQLTIKDLRKIESPPLDLFGGHA